METQGDLLEQQEEISDKTDDSATNQGSADMPAGWGIEEGEFANFSAKGKSGSNRPDHNEQTGPSLVGRQGQADGDTTTGSGSIAEGDNNIEARRTQDGAQSGQVQIEGQNDAKATGGGKLAGYDDEYGMQGSGPRRDAATGSSPLGMQALLRRQAEQVYAKATLLHVRTASMDEAILLMRRTEDAMAALSPCLARPHAPTRQRQGRPQRGQALGLRRSFRAGDAMRRPRRFAVRQRTGEVAAGCFALRGAGPRDRRRRR